MMACMVYLALSGFSLFLAGRITPKEWFHPDQFPFRPFAFEKNGRLYHCLHIRLWQGRVPDMSRILPALIPQKKLTQDFRQQLPAMVRETCVAEWTHFLLCLTGFYCLKLWKGTGGLVFSLLNLLVNSAYIVIQRFNRPRLMGLLEHTAQKSCLEERTCVS